MKHSLEALFLSLVVIAVSYSSGLWFLGIPALALVALSLRAHLKNKTPRYLKSVAYGMIVPFFFWWFLSPTNGSVFSPWLLIIPSWYFTFLAIWQFRGEGRGGYQVFVIWNAIFVLMLTLRNAERVQYVLIALSLLAMLLYVKPPKQNVRFVISLLLATASAALFVFGFQKAYEWRSNKMRSGEWEEKYRNERSMMGFSTVAALGSFKTNYVSDKNSQIVLRLWTDRPPRYLRAVAYQNYSAGIWNLPRDEEWLQSDRYIGDYAVFASEDSTDEAVWVQAALNTFEFAFVPMGAGIGFKEADSIVRTVGSNYKTPGQNHGDWYYLRTARADTADSAKFLNVPQRMQEFLDFTAKIIGVEKNMSAREATEKINAYLIGNFRYELSLPFGYKVQAGEDPLMSFWNYRAGFCEYFASFETLLLRHIGIPARYVTGFAIPERSPSGNYFVFRRASSHAWVEVFDGGKWNLSDPTPPAPPGMFEFEMTNSNKLGEILKSKMIYFMHVLRDGEWRHSLDSWSNVIENLLVSIWLKIVLALLIIAVVVRYIYKKIKNATKADVVSERVREFSLLLDRAEKSLAKCGYRRAPGETVQVFAERLSAIEPPQKSRVKRRFKVALEQLIQYEANRWK